MAIGDLRNKVAMSDVQAMNDKKNPPLHDPDFAPKVDTAGDDYFSDLDDMSFQFDTLSANDGFGAPSSNTSNNQNSLSSSIFGNSGASNSLPFGNTGINLSGSPGASPFMSSPLMMNQQVPVRKDTAMDELIDGIMDSSKDAAVSTWAILKELIKSVKSRNADDLGYVSVNLIKTGAGMIAGFFIMLAFKVLSGSKLIPLNTIGANLMGAGMLVCGTGLAGIATSAWYISKTHKVQDSTIDDVPDIESAEDNITADYEDNLDDIFDDLFGNNDSEDNYFGSTEIEGTSYNDTFNNLNTKQEETIKFNMDEIHDIKSVDLKEQLDNVHANQYMSRENLVNTFKLFFASNTPGFSDIKTISQSTEEFQLIETNCLKALSNLTKTKFTEIETHVETIKETFFSYEIRMQRVRGLTKTEDIAREMEAYFRESSEDLSVNATVDIEGDFYKIIITKGEDAIITFGDLFRQDSVYKYFIDTKNKLPLIAGINEYGKPILVDGKLLDVMLIAGKQRSGKSWYVLNILLSMMLFNTPEDVQFILVDPKKSNLFNTLSLMPHVCGLHDDRDIISIMKDLIHGEGARRKKLLEDNRCDDIWALHKKGIKLPVLYLVIDEVMTIMANLGNAFAEFSELMMVIMSQLPSLGIRMIVVPHRSVGVIDKKNRALISFAAAIRADNEIVNETLGITKWSRRLVNPGDLALKMNGVGGEMFLKGPAVTVSDEGNAELIVNAARAFYKMGVDLPDMYTVGFGYNRNEESVKERLEINTVNRIQYDASSIFSDLD